MNLVNTNIFLEILLNQEKSEICKSFLTKISAPLMFPISLFTLLE